jgi:hypothetical protein
MTRATSIAVRLRRIEVTYVNVPVTEEIAASLSAQAGGAIDYSGMSSGRKL